MPIAAIPRYLGPNFAEASPGLRFGMFLELWGVNSRENTRLWTTHDVNYRRAGRDNREREFQDENKTHALKQATRLTQSDKSILAGLASRQQATAEALSESQRAAFSANAVAPFTTGLGNEHPLENGFAFLNPYGLPYLPGSGVKGVVRRAAEELASGEWGKTHGWSDKQEYPIPTSGNPPAPVQP